MSFLIQATFCLPDLFFNCLHKQNIYVRKVRKFQDSVAIETFEKSQYKQDPGT